MIQVSDHALMRFLERAGGFRPEPLRAAIAGSLARAHHAARRMGQTRFRIVADGLAYVVVDDVVVTILPDEGGGR